MTHLEVLWQEPRVERFLTRLAGFSRLILMDPRGLGLSDRLTDVPTLDERVDLVAVLDAAGGRTGRALRERRHRPTLHRDRGTSP